MAWRRRFPPGSRTSKQAPRTGRWRLHRGVVRVTYLVARARRHEVLGGSRCAPGQIPILSHVARPRWTRMVDQAGGQAIHATSVRFTALEVPGIRVHHDRDALEDARQPVPGYRLGLEVPQEGKVLDLTQASDRSCPDIAAPAVPGEQSRLTTTTWLRFSMASRQRMRWRVLNCTGTTLEEASSMNPQSMLVKVPLRARCRGGRMHCRAKAVNGSSGGTACPWTT